MATCLQDFILENAGRLRARVGVTTAVGTTTTLVDNTRFGGPKNAAEWARGSPIRITKQLDAGTARVGQNTFLSAYDPTTGTITVSPAIIQPVIGDTFIVVQKTIAEDIDRLIEALNRALTRSCLRRMGVPLTYVPNGDLMAALVSTGWTVFNNATIAYVDNAHPDGWYQRLMQLTGGTTGQRVASTTLKASPGDTWNLAYTIQITTPGSGTGIAIMVVQDETNSVPITPSFQFGTASTSSFAPVDVLATFVVPATCSQISFRPTVGKAGDVGLFGPISAAPLNARNYMGQTWLEYTQRVTGFSTYLPMNSASGSVPNPMNRRWRAANVGRDYDQIGVGVDFTFPSLPPFPLYADAVLNYPALVLDGDLTQCPENLALAGMAVEFYEWAVNATKQPMIIRNRTFYVSPFDSNLQMAKDDWKAAMATWNLEKRIVVKKLVVSGWRA